MMEFLQSGHFNNEEIGLTFNIRKKFEYLPKIEVERTLENFKFFSSNLSKGNRIEIRFW